MYRPLMIRAGWVPVCLLLFATASFSQPAPSAAASPTPSPSPTPPLQIIYTGKSFGYFRYPNLQDPDSTSGCSATSSRSKAADSFLLGPQDKDPKKQSEQQTKFHNAIRVSAGDNFAPQLEAREFSIPSDPNATEYVPGNKELYNWYGSKWIRPEKLKKNEQDKFEEQVAKGMETIPTDNVACFLAAAHYSAIVPGKHDFYFGAERVRMFARFLAGISQTDYQPVQMLGANLVIKTTRLEEPAAAPNKSKWSDTYSVAGLREGKSVYPWFSAPVQLTLTVPGGDNLLPDLTAWFAALGKKNKPDLEAFITKKLSEATPPMAKKDWEALRALLQNLNSVSVCPAGAYNEITVKSCDDHGWKPVEAAALEMSKNTLTYTMSIRSDPALSAWPGKNKHYSTLEPGKKYGLCLRDPAVTTGIEKGCLSFLVYTPFFYSPRPVPQEMEQPVPPGIAHYADPDPFVLIRNAAQPDREVVIFGVVDPSIGEQVGVLNFSWLNHNSKLSTVVSAEEPAEALKEQLAYFDKWYQDKIGGNFSGVRVLLAQMSPQRARVLAARLPRFQIVVTAADEEQGTSETVMSSEWSSKTAAGTFVAVPLPYVNSKQKETVEGTVHFGLIEASKTTDGWRFEGKSLKQAEVSRVKASASTFWGLVKAKLKECLRGDFPTKDDKPEDQLKLLTLCVMRDRLGADVALIQKRDFFDILPNEAGDAPNEVQQILDRIIWKGDLLTLLYLPGSTIKKALDQSKKYDDEDSNLLSLADEKLRGLVYVGAKRVGREYLINEAPIDDKKIYAVATTDYIGAGDTGYTDLATALNPKTRPAQFPDKLVPISGLVCRKLYAAEANLRCLPDFPTGSYLDSSSAEAMPAPRPRPFSGKLHDLFPFKAPADPVAPTTPSGKLEQRAQHRPIWILSLKNLSLQFSSLNNNLTDAQIDQKYGGITTPGITTHQNHNVTFGLGARLSRSSHRRELFAEIGMDYKEQSTGVSNTTPQIAQLTNRVAADLGVVRNFRGGRSPITWGGKLSLHAETTLKQPFTTFTLGTQTVVDAANNIKIQDRLTISQKRAVLILPRAGLRLQNRANSLEVGFEGGKEIYALSGFRFTTQGTVDTCLASATKSLASCIKSKSTPPNATITRDSAASAILEDRWRAGAYWKFTFSIPFTPKVKYDLTQEADFFFVNFHRDNPTDIRYRDSSKNSLKFMVLPNFSIGPTLQLLFYQNKVNRDFLFQKQFGIEASFAFDLFNRREKGVQIKHKP